MICTRCHDRGVIRRACELAGLVDEYACGCAAGEKLRGVIAGVVKEYEQRRRPNSNLRSSHIAVRRQINARHVH